MHVRAILIEVLREVVDRRLSKEPIRWDAVFARLEEARATAAAQISSNGGLAASVVSAVNLLSNCVSGDLDLDRLRIALEKLDISAGWEAGFSADLLRSGRQVVLDDGDRTIGSSALTWEKFIQFYAGAYGLSEDDKSGVEQLWLDLFRGTVRLPIRDLDIADSHGSTSSWVTDDAHHGSKLKDGDPTRDVYDALGLNWTARGGKTRAVLLCCPMYVRLRAAQSLHCPNAIDGWGNLFFVPRRSTDLPWPHHGTATARPTSDEPSMPEAIHGPATASRDSVEVIPLKRDVEVGNRLIEHGEHVMLRAIDRLRHAVGS